MAQFSIKRLDLIHNEYKAAVDRKVRENNNGIEKISSEIGDRIQSAFIIKMNSELDILPPISDGIVCS